MDWGTEKKIEHNIRNSALAGSCEAKKRQVARMHETVSRLEALKPDWSRQAFLNTFRFSTSTVWLASVANTTQKIRFACKIFRTIFWDLKPVQKTVPFKLGPSKFE